MRRDARARSLQFLLRPVTNELQQVVTVPGDCAEYVGCETEPTGDRRQNALGGRSDVLHIARHAGAERRVGRPQVGPLEQQILWSSRVRFLFATEMNLLAPVAFVSHPAPAAEVRGVLDRKLSLNFDR